MFMRRMKTKTRRLTDDKLLAEPFKEVRAEEAGKNRKYDISNADWSDYINTVCVHF